jgi:hypothetical protein
MSTSTPPRFPPAPSGDSSSRPDCRNQLFANGCSALAFNSEDASCHGCLLSSPKLYHYRPPGLHSFGLLPRFLLQSHTWARVPLNTRNRCGQTHAADLAEARHTARARMARGHPYGPHPCRRDRVARSALPLPLPGRAKDHRRPLVGPAFLRPQAAAP